MTSDGRHWILHDLPKPEAALDTHSLPAARAHALSLNPATDEPTSIFASLNDPHILRDHKHGQAKAPYPVSGVYDSMRNGTDCHSHSPRRSPPQRFL